MLDSGLPVGVVVRVTVRSAGAVVASTIMVALPAQLAIEGSDGS